MNFLARNTDYAVRALIYMAQKAPDFISTADLDRDLRLPRPFMRKSLQVLTRAGYLESVKGKNGGFRLRAAPENVGLMEVMTLFQGPVSLGDCLFQKKICACRSNCSLRKEVKTMESLVIGHLRGVTLASLMKG